jgi:hypothetical protein
MDPVSFRTTLGCSGDGADDIGTAAAVVVVATAVVVGGKTNDCINVAGTVAAAVVAADIAAAVVVAVVAAPVVGAAVVVAAVVVAAAADVTSGVAAVVPGAPAAELLTAVVVAANDAVPGPAIGPDVPLYMSTALETALLPAVTLMRRQHHVPQTPQSSNKHTSQTRIIHAQQLQHKPSVTQRKGCNYLWYPPQRWPRSQQMSQQDRSAPH